MSVAGRSRGDLLPSKTLILTDTIMNLELEKPAAGAVVSYTSVGFHH